MNTIYFQPPGIKKEYCEVGMIHETDLSTFVFKRACKYNQRGKNNTSRTGNLRSQA